MMGRFLTSSQRAYLKLIGFFFAMALLARTAFFCGFYADGSSAKIASLLKAFYLGLKFDLRVSIMIAFPVAVFSLAARRKFLSWRGWPKLSSIFYTLVSVLILGVYGADWGYYSYLRTRLSASVIELILEDPLVSLRMVWESYPVVTGALLLTVASFFIYRFLKRVIFNYDMGLRPAPRKLSLALIILLSLAGLYGKLAYYPLRWSEAFFANDRFVASLGLNPIHYFFDTYKNRQKGHDLALVKKYYPAVARHLGVMDLDEKNLNFKRVQPPTPLGDFAKKPNVIVFVMESLTAHRMEVFGNPTGATPFMDETAKKGMLFTNFYTPSESTARGIFALITSVPDVNRAGSSSRNPLIVEQNTAFNAFAGYEKYFFIGGSANWGNIRGILKNNIEGLRLFEEGMYDSPRVDVWGLSDYHLFSEAFEILSKAKSPFIAVIQSSGFHRPYTIPEDRGEFEVVSDPKIDIKKWGWSSLEEYNSMRFTDYAFGEFMKRFQKSPFSQNTLTALLGDHGLRDSGSNNLTPTQIKFATERFHVPLIFHWPSYLGPRLNKTVASQVDVLPTLAAMTGHPFFNTGMGRNLFDKELMEKSPYTMSYVYYKNPHQIFLFGRDHFVTGTPEKVDSLFDLRAKTAPQNSKDSNGALFEEMEHLTNGLYQSSQYLLYHNRRE
ncbi:MAG: sulfatase-like hydrolase/transferase [Bacteriovoracales bacterium]|nr:sulfatase-like hydrolase/transferase [Bacteriovoracales bacterium]